MPGCPLTIPTVWASKLNPTEPSPSRSQLIKFGTGYAMGTSLKVTVIVSSLTSPVVLFVTNT